MCLATYVSSLGCSVGPSDLGDALRDGALILLLDGVDEVIKRVPTILEGIKELSHRFPRAQVVVASRAFEGWSERVPFFGVTLLPFTDEQRRHFIMRWFGEQREEDSKRVVDHLERRRDIGELVRNPLLTTILCLLEENGIALPTNEARLYRERMRLLMGVYDLAKGVRRVSCAEEDLQVVAQRLAFRLHQKGRREASLEWFRDVAATVHGLAADTAHRAAEELCDPCAILVPMTEEGLLGFGHLRYQEYLAALELMRDRNIPISTLLEDPWWAGVLVLFARMNENLSWLVRGVLRAADGAEPSGVVWEMIAVRPPVERDSLEAILKSHVGSREEEPTLEQALEWGTEAFPYDTDNR